jgi:peptide deformylase
MGKIGILQAGHPLLRSPAAAVPSHLFNSNALTDLIGLMKMAMRDAPGVGLAAPQIGVPLQVIVLEDTEALMRFLTPREREERGRSPIPFQAWINPSMKPLSDEKAELYEGCLSVLGFEAKVKRYVHIEVDGFDETGKRKGPIEMRGWPARIVQHELDHLHGTLYVDRMDSKTLATRASREGHALSDLMASLGLN